MADKIKLVYSDKWVEKFKHGFAMDGAVQQLAATPEAQQKLGIRFSKAFLSHGGEFKGAEGFALDAGVTTPVTTPSNGTPLQFLQQILPGHVNVLTKVRKADEIAPVAIVGDYWAQEVDIATMEHTADPAEWADNGGLTFVSFNETFEGRQIVRFGLKSMSSLVGDARANATGMSAEAERSAAVTTGMELHRNKIAFYGYNGGNGRTYGILNDPNLPPITALADGAGGDSRFSLKTVAEIVSDLTTMYNDLEVQSGGNIDVINDRIKITIPTGLQSEFYKTDASFANGLTVMEWMNQNHPGSYLVVAPQFAQASGSDSVIYMQADVVSDSGTDDGQVMFQAVQTRIMGTGSVPNSQGGVEEGYLMATAGTWVKRPYGVIRKSGC